ncbi:MAG: stage III sporulation protein AF [Bacillota bacterium]
MIEIDNLRDWVRNIILIVLFASFVEMLLPNSKFRGYIRVVIGFFVILVIMGPIMDLLNFKGSELDLSIIEQQQNQNLNEIITTGKQLRIQEVKRAQEKYKRKLAKQMEAVVKLNSDFKKAAIDVVIDENNQIKEVIIDTNSLEITPVQVNINEPEPKNNKFEQQQKNLKDLLLNLYGLKKEQIIFQ